MTITMEAPTYIVPRDQFWAQGCDRCRFGIQYPIPALRHDRPLYQERPAPIPPGSNRGTNGSPNSAAPLAWEIDR